MLPIPEGYVTRIEKLIFNFIWGKKDKIRRRSLICAHENGGLNMIDIESFFLSLKATWIGRFNDHNKAWTYIPQYYMNKLAPFEILSKMTFQSARDMPELLKLPKFYQEVILSLCKSKPTENIDTKCEIFSQMLWGNRKIKVDGKCLHSTLMIDSNFIYVRDIMLQNGTLVPDIYDRLNNKIHYFRDMTLVRKGLRQYRQILNNEDRYLPNLMDNEQELTFPSKSKIYYQKLKEQKELPPKSFNYWNR